MCYNSRDRVRSNYYVAVGSDQGNYVNLREPLDTDARTRTHKEQKHTHTQGHLAQPSRVSSCYEK